MYKIVLEKMCSCAKKDEDLHKNWLDKSFSSKEEAVVEALRLANHANATWCKKHRFYAVDEGENIKIIVETSCPKEV